MVNVTLFHSRQVILVDANVTFSHVAVDNKSEGWGVKKKKKKPLTLNYTSAFLPKVNPQLD